MPLSFPNGLSQQQFLRSYWQQRPLLLPNALNEPQSSISRNELAWLATLDDVESRLVFTERRDEATFYRAENGPFSVEELSALPARDWTLLVHDVEKHVPALRRRLESVRFIPDWRIDDIMVSFAAPGGSVGPHSDHYDVFLCQGIGVRNWRYRDDHDESDEHASQDLQLLTPFTAGDDVDLAAGDVLYLPPGVAHWGVAKRACMTYSIGLRAPQKADLLHEDDCLNGDDAERFYEDPVLNPDLKVSGYISELEIQHCREQFAFSNTRSMTLALGHWATLTKSWLRPETASKAAADRILATPQRLHISGMARLAFTDQHLFVNGEHLTLPEQFIGFVGDLCRDRALAKPKMQQLIRTAPGRQLVSFLLLQGAFTLPDDD